MLCSYRLPFAAGPLLSKERLKQEAANTNRNPNRTRLPHGKKETPPLG